LFEAGAGDARGRHEPIEITLEFRSGSTPMLVTEPGANRYRLEEDPFFEALPGGHDGRRFVKVVKRSGLKRFQFLIDEMTAISPEFEVVIAEVEAAYSDLICTLRHLMAPPGASLGPLPNWRANGPCACLLSSTSAVCTPFSTTVSRAPLAVIS
jgi:hypothetical protein